MRPDDSIQGERARAHVGDIRGQAACKRSLPTALLPSTGVAIKRGWNSEKQMFWFGFVLLLGLHNACAGDNSPEDYKDLKAISFFGSISVRVHIGDSARPAVTSGLSSEELSQFMRLQFAKYFADVPFRGIDASHWSDEEYRRAMGRFSCRVWIEGDDSPLTYQVKCQISTADHLNIVGDASLGYGPKDRVSAIVRQQIDRMVESFAQTYFQARNEP